MDPNQIQTETNRVAGNETSSSADRTGARSAAISGVGSGTQSGAQSGTRSGAQRFGPLLGGIVLGVLLASLFLHATAAARTQLWNRLSAMLTGRTTTIDTSSVAVVEKVRKLSRLETVVYSIDKVVEGQRENVLLPNFLAGEKLLLVSHGEVIAGIDLGKLQAGDVSVAGDTVKVHLPPTEVLTARLDNQRTRVYSRSTGLLVAADPNLESAVRQAAEEQIKQAAIADGILDKAHTNAQAAVTTLLYGLGFHTVSVD